mmetsp:Transcript_22347/g.56984  ORF Transcript_22347/g.56984 Transcript_22347/m.56984 type:complete len:164 (+) Transcript_22347:780-1271(+)
MSLWSFPPWPWSIQRVQRLLPQRYTLGSISQYLVLLMHYANCGRRIQLRQSTQIQWSTSRLWAICLRCRLCMKCRLALSSSLSGLQQLWFFVRIAALPEGTTKLCRHRGPKKFAVARQDRSRVRRRTQCCAKISCRCAAMLSGVGSSTFADAECLPHGEVWEK